MKNSLILLSVIMIILFPFAKMKKSRYFLMLLNCLISVSYIMTTYENGKPVIIYAYMFFISLLLLLTYNYFEETGIPFVKIDFNRLSVFYFIGISVLSVIYAMSYTLYLPQITSAPKKELIIDTYSYALAALLALGFLVYFIFSNYFSEKKSKRGLQNKSREIALLPLFSGFKSNFIAVFILIFAVYITVIFGFSTDLLFSTGCVIIILMIEQLRSHDEKTASVLSNKNLVLTGYISAIVFIVFTFLYTLFMKTADSETVLFKSYFYIMKIAFSLAVSALLYSSTMKTEGPE